MLSTLTSSLASAAGTRLCTCIITCPSCPSLRPSPASFGHHREAGPSGRSVPRTRRSAHVPWLAGGPVEQRAPRVHTVCGGDRGERRGTATKTAERHAGASGCTAAASNTAWPTVSSWALPRTRFCWQIQPEGWRAASSCAFPGSGLRSAKGRQLLGTRSSDTRSLAAASGGSAARGYALELAVALDQWLAAGNPRADGCSLVPDAAWQGRPAGAGMGCPRDRSGRIADVAGGRRGVRRQ